MKENYCNVITLVNSSGSKVRVVADCQAHGFLHDECEFYKKRPVFGDYYCDNYVHGTCCSDEAIQDALAAQVLEGI